MTPTSPLAGLLVGLLDAGVVVLAVVVVLFLVHRRESAKAAPVTHPVAEDNAPSIAGHSHLHERVRHLHRRNTHSDAA